MTFRFDNSFARDLTGHCLGQLPHKPANPTLLLLNEGLAGDLGLDLATLYAHGAGWFSGASLPEGAEPIAMAYAGHQFGGFSAQLGDGRAHLLGEHISPAGQRWDIQLKGSGRTAFSRGGDGKAALGPMLREYLIAEAMAALKIPTTRILAVAKTGEMVLREKGPLHGAVATRIGQSHIRVGSFQFFAARGEAQKLRQLFDYTVARHFPQAAQADNPALALWDMVMQRQASLIAAWMGVGFVHGVMNTDNMALSGETIDYGPCAFLDSFAPTTAFSSIDRQGRYAWANQPSILAWNLARFAETLLGFIDPDQNTAIDLANDRLATIDQTYQAAWHDVMRQKLGLLGQEQGDAALIEDLLSEMAAQSADWTQTFRMMARATLANSSDPMGFLGSDAMQSWLVRWRARLAQGASARMLAANPAVIPRNHLVEQALDAAGDGDMAPFSALLAAVQVPFASEHGREVYCLPPPTGFGQYVTFCGT